MKHRKIKSEIAFYLQNFDQIEYREYVDRQTRDCCRIIEKKVEINSTQIIFKIIMYQRLKFMTFYQMMG